jgi:hypothetical protein
LKLVASKVCRLRLKKTRLSGNTRRKSKSYGETRRYREHRLPGRAVTPKLTASYVPCECEHSADLRPRRLGKYSWKQATMMTSVTEDAVTRRKYGISCEMKTLRKAQYTRKWSLCKGRLTRPPHVILIGLLIQVTNIK